MTLPRREVCKSGKTCKIVNEAVPGSCAWECLKFEVVKMECEDCGGNGFKDYNKEKGVLCCVECGQLKDMEGLEGGIVECDGCGYISKAHEDGDVCPFCDGGKMSLPKINIIIIETVEEDGSKWGISFTNSNPEAKDYVGCASHEDAEKLQAKLKEVNFIVA